MLAGLLSAPSELEPRTNPKQAEANRLGVLDAMLDQKRISSVQHAQAVDQKIFLVGSTEAPPPPNATLVHPVELQSTTQPYFVDYVVRYLVAKYGDDIVYRGGLKVETTLDPGLQTLAENTVKNSLAGTDSPLEMAMVSVEPGTGFVKALVGGRDFAKSQVNLALGACPATDGKPNPTDGPICLAGGGTGRQPGSAFKVFTLAKAFEEGIGPRRVYSGPGTYTFPRCSGTQCTVKNVESGSYGSISLREATENSVNTVFAQLVGDVGIKETAEMAHRLGITMVSADGNQPSGEPYGASLTLGAAEVSPLDMAAAFSVLAARGNQFAATPIVKVTDAYGQVLEDNTKRAPKRVLAENIADNLNDVLKGVITSGTGKGADIGRPDGSAGKTGSADLNRDAWFVGYTPALSTSVWMGYSDSQHAVALQHQGSVQGLRGHDPGSHLEGLHGRGHEGQAAFRLPRADPARRRRGRRAPQGAGAAGPARGPGSRPDDRHRPARDHRPGAHPRPRVEPPAGLHPPRAPERDAAVGHHADDEAEAEVPLGGAALSALDSGRRRRRRAARAAREHLLAGAADRDRDEDPVGAGATRVVRARSHPEHLTPVVHQRAALTQAVGDDVVLDAGRRDRR